MPFTAGRIPAMAHHRWHPLDGHPWDAWVGAESFDDEIDEVHCEYVGTGRWLANIAPRQRKRPTPGKPLERVLRH